VAYKKGVTSIQSIVAFLSPSSKDSSFVLERKILVAEINQNTNSVKGPWPLTRWPYLTPPEIVTNAQNNFHSTEWLKKPEYTPRLPFAGCLNNVPLKYGDMENDGDSELVLFLNGELIIFSPKYQKIVFAAFALADDWFTESAVSDEQKVSASDKKSYQYISEYLAYNGISSKAFRSYTKIYVDDFDGDKKPDIVTWQKNYGSNLTADTTKGFSLLENRWGHYERDLTAQAKTEQGVTGEYLPQDTTEENIKSWLAAKKLTWQQGYPSKSECAGEEGKLIPEMHDALLNDSDVLK